MLGTLNVSQTGLNSAKIAVENVSNNIANQNTEGYKKRVVQASEIEQIDSRFTGRGVETDSAYRVTSQYMYDNILSENTKLANYDKQSTTLGNVESIFKETDESGFSADLDRYFQSVEDLRANPQSEVSKTIFQNQGEVLVESLQNLYTGMEKQEIFEKDELVNNVGIVNDIIEEIGVINEQIGNFSVASNDLLDKRDQLEKELSKYADIEVDRSNGDYELKMSGTTVVRANRNIAALEVVETNTAQVSKYLNTDGIGSNIEFNDDFTANDVLSFRLNNETEVSVTFGEDFDVNGDGIISATDKVDANNYMRALVDKINSTTDTQNSVVAYLGNYEIDANGDKNEIGGTSNNFLLVEARVPGTEGSFESKLTLVEKDPLDATDIKNRTSFYQNDDYSSDAVSKVGVSINDKEISFSGGILKSQTDNLSSDSENNKIQDYKDKLDLFAKTLSDLTDSYIQTGTDEYYYGEDYADDYLYDSTDSSIKEGTISSVGLFSGGDVKSLTFNSNNVNDLSQDDLDYLSTIQWKKDISFTGKKQDTNNDDVSSLSEFFQELRVDIASDKGSNDFLLETQGAVQQSLESSFNELIGVDPDEEMLNLIKFQAAYTANAKVITAIDEMLQVLLGLKN